MATTNQAPGRRAFGFPALAGVAVIASVLAACGAGVAPSSSPPSTTSASAAPSVATAASSAMATPSAPASARPSAVAAIPDGVWVSDPISAATVRAMFAATHLSEADKEHGLTEDFGMTPSRKQMTERFELKDGSWTVSGSWDGAPMTVGSRGSAAFPDATTIAMQDNVSLITYRVAISGTTMKLTMLSDSAWANLADDVEPVIVFCTAPWHRQV